MLNKDDSTSDVVAGILLFLFICLEIVLVIIALFAGGGIESETNLIIFTISSILGLFGTLMIFLLKLGQWIVTRVKQQKKMGWLGCILHDPETSIIPIKKGFFKWLKNPLISALIFLIPASIFGTIQVYQNTFFTALPARVTQQIHEGSKAILSTFPQDLEVYLPVMIVGFLVFMIDWKVKYKKLDRNIANLLIYLVIPIGYALLWLSFHLWRYSSSDISAQYVFIFGIISAYLLVIFRSLIPVLVFKITNNLYQHFNAVIQADERVLMITIILNFVLVVGLISFFTLKAKRKKTKAGA